ncbi:THUMP-like domain-containing protein [Streptomyces sp. NBC_00105]|uniref:THUMP-like domain-containing protein n=1 Tax=Streptomyces sp. NBC_00105 TaxID=2903622 RepID=UPI00324BCDC9
MDLATFRALLTDEGQTLLAALQDTGPAEEPVTPAGLRRAHPAELVAAAREQVRLRRLAAAKFGRHAPHLYFTPDSVALSSHLAVSDYKLDRVLDELGVVMIDAMSLGSGADAHVLGWSHATSAVDGDRLTVEVAAANRTGMDEPMLDLTCADVTTFDSQGEAVFIDLMRHAGPDGDHDPERYDPPLSWALERLHTTGAGWIRLAPGVPDHAVPDLGRAHEAEWISHDGHIQEAVLWFGLDGMRISRPTTVRKATLLPARASLTGRGLPHPAVRPVGRYLYAPDPAVIHARLLAELSEDLAAGLVEEAGTLLTSDGLRPTPFATAYEVTEVLPFDSAGLKAALRGRTIGRVTVAAVHGLQIEADAFHHDLTPQDPRAATVFITGPASRPAMLITAPAPAAHTP